MFNISFFFCDGEIYGIYGIYEIYEITSPTLPLPAHL